MYRRAAKKNERRPFKFCRVIVKGMIAAATYFGLRLVFQPPLENLLPTLPEPREMLEGATLAEPIFQRVTDEEALYTLQEAALPLSLTNKKSPFGIFGEAKVHDFLGTADFCYRKEKSYSRYVNGRTLAEQVIMLNSSISNLVNIRKTRSRRFGTGSMGGYCITQYIDLLSKNITRAEDILFSRVILPSEEQFGFKERSVRYGGGQMLLSIHYDLSLTVIIPLHGTREILLLHPSCNVPVENRKYKRDYRNMCGSKNIFGFKKRQKRMKDVRCRHRMKRALLEPGTILYIPKKWYHSIESNSAWWTSYVAR